MKEQLLGAALLATSFHNQDAINPNVLPPAVTRPHPWLDSPQTQIVSLQSAEESLQNPNEMADGIKLAISAFAIALVLKTYAEANSPDRKIQKKGARQARDAAVAATALAAAAILYELWK